MNYIIGIDGGATKTRCVVTDLFLHVVYEHTGVSSNILVDGPKHASENIYSIIQECLEKLVISPFDIAGICVGTAGAGRQEDANALKDELGKLLGSTGFKKELLVVGDNEIAFEAAFAGNPGMILISGTGSICYGRNESGERFRIGGYGRYIGDEGSGYSIGSKGLKYALRSFDGRTDDSVLTREIFNAMNCNSPAEVIGEVYKNDYDIASLAKTVVEVAMGGDELARKIVDIESDLLVSHVKAGLKNFNTNPIPVSLSGSLLTNENYYEEVVKSKLKGISAISLREPAHSPEMGAAIMALKHIQNK